MRLYWEYGDHDLAVAEVVLDQHARVAAYLIGQAIEKWLKAVQAAHVNMDNKDAREKLSGDHDMVKIVRVICAIHGSRLRMEPSILERQVQDLLQGVPLHLFPRLRYPRWNQPKSCAEGWLMQPEDVRQMLEKAKGLQRWLRALMNH